MPLVVPDVQSTSSDPTEFWMSELMGKTLTGDGGKHDASNFSKDKLPSKHRVVQDGGMMTMDFQQDRLNVHVDKDGIVKKVTHG